MLWCSGEKPTIDAHHNAQAQISQSHTITKNTTLYVIWQCAYVHGKETLVKCYIIEIMHPFLSPKNALVQITKYPQTLVNTSWLTQPTDPVNSGYKSSPNVMGPFQQFIGKYFFLPLVILSTLSIFHSDVGPFSTIH